MTRRQRWMRKRSLVQMSMRNGRRPLSLRHHDRRAAVAVFVLPIRIQESLLDPASMVARRAPSSAGRLLLTVRPGAAERPRGRAADRRTTSPVKRTRARGVAERVGALTRVCVCVSLSVGPDADHCRDSDQSAAPAEVDRPTSDDEGDAVVPLPTLCPTQERFGAARGVSRVGCGVFSPSSFRPPWGERPRARRHPPPPTPSPRSWRRSLPSDPRPPAAPPVAMRTLRRSPRRARLRRPSLHRSLLALGRCGPPLPRPDRVRNGHFFASSGHAASQDFTCEYEFLNS